MAVGRLGQEARVHQVVVESRHASALAARSEVPRGDWLGSAGCLPLGEVSQYKRTLSYHLRARRTALLLDS